MLVCSHANTVKVKILYSVDIYRGICDQCVKLFLLLRQDTDSWLNFCVHLKHTPSSSSILMHSESEPKH